MSTGTSTTYIGLREIQNDTTHDTTNDTTHDSTNDVVLMESLSPLFDDSPIIPHENTNVADMEDEQDQDTALEQHTPVHVDISVLPMVTFHRTNPSPSHSSRREPLNVSVSSIDSVTSTSSDVDSYIPLSHQHNLQHPSQNQFPLQSQVQSPVLYNPRVINFSSSNTRRMINRSQNHGHRHNQIAGPTGRHTRDIHTSAGTLSINVNDNAGITNSINVTNSAQRREHRHAENTNSQQQMLTVSAPSFTELSQPAFENERYVDLDRLEELGLKCSVCLTIIQHTVVELTTCAHKFCSKCIYSMFCDPTANFLIARCPLCRRTIEDDNVMISDQYTTLLERTLIRCKNGECKQQLSRQEMIAHGTTCEYNKTHCVYCRNIIFIKSQKEHESKCDFFKIPCPECKMLVERIFLTEHEQNGCCKSQAQCPFCEFETVRENLQIHVDACIHKPIPCRNGCNNLVKQMDVTLHNSKCAYKTTSCQYCKIKVPYIKIHEHYLACPEYPIECTFCGKTLVKKKEAAHKNECDYHPQECRNNGCHMEIQRRNMNTHITKDCPYRTARCSKCKQEYITANRADHKSKCIMELITCINCKSQLLRKDKYQHEYSCLYMTQNCIYAYAGCKSTYLRKDEQDHMTSHAVEHVKLLHSFINTQNRQ